MLLIREQTQKLICFLPPPVKQLTLTSSKNAYFYRVQKYTPLVNFSNKSLTKMSVIWYTTTLNSIYPKNVKLFLLHVL